MGRGGVCAGGGQEDEGWDVGSAFKSAEWVFDVSGYGGEGIVELSREA